MTNTSLKSHRKGIAVAGLRGGSGKTIAAIGIIRALLKRGKRIAPFKKGPDYIDPAWLTFASESQCHNLDTFLMDHSAIINNYIKSNSDADIAVLEGNRGLFDGFDSDGTHSTAELVKLIEIPLVLVVDCTKVGRTVAALVYGCQTFEEKLPLKGVILNKVAGERHKNIITDAIEKNCSIPVLGAIPRFSAISLKERHLGLVPVYEYTDPSQLIHLIGKTVEENTDIDKIIKIAESNISKSDEAILPGSAYEIALPGFQKKSEPHDSDPEAKKSISGDYQPTVGIIRDSAFNFYYVENLDEIEKCGAKIIELNSISDRSIPKIDALYIGGGFPETHAERLSSNAAFRLNLKELIEDGLPVYAECGGVEYLSNSIIINKKTYPMVGVFPYVFEISKKPQAHGYTIFEVDRSNPYYPAGTVVRGHEFRYSIIINITEPHKISTAFKMKRGKGISDNRGGVMYKNVLATFSHTHASSSNVEWIKSIVNLALARRLKNE